MKRKLLLSAIMVACACLVGLVGCGLPGGGQKAPLVEAQVSSVFTTGDYEGSTLLVIEFDVKNNADYPFYANGLGMDTTVTLEGESLKESYLSSNNPRALSDASSISPGEEGKAQLAYVLPSTEGTVEVVTKIETVDYSDTVEIVNESIDLSSVESFQSESEYGVEINNSFMTDDGEGSDLVVVELTFKNESDSATSFGSAITTKLFQNDVELKSGYLPYNHPSYDSDASSNSYTDIKAGASIDVQMVYVLNDKKSPIEIKCIDWESFDQAVVLESEIKLDGTSVDTSSKYSFTVEGAFVGVDEYSEVPEVILVCEFANNSDETISFSSALEGQAFQDGRELSEAYLYGTNSLTYEDVQPGKTVAVLLAWKLNSADAPVELTVIDRYHYAKEEVFSETYTIDELIENSKKFAEEYAGVISGDEDITV